MVEGDHHRAHPRYVEERSEESLCSILHARVEGAGEDGC
jgi:hypothetical protein